MVDYETLRNILKAEDEALIKYGDLIDYESMQLLAFANQQKVRRLIQKGGHVNKGCFFHCQLECEMCGKLYIEEKCSKSRVEKIFGVLSGRQMGHILCPGCHEKWELQVKEERRKQEENHKKNLSERTDSFIDNFLNPDKSWRPNVKTYIKIQSLLNNSIDWHLIQRYICEMDYHDFLNTPYWKAISEKVRQKAGFKCQICNSSESLNVHHRSYENHGDELHHMEDLICICKDCNEKHHFE